MKTSSFLALALCAGGGAVAIGAASCSSDSSPPNGETPGSTPSGVCANPSLPVVFAPMYSAYIPNSQHTFQVPAIVAGVSGSTVKWSASDPSMVHITADDTTGSGGVLITTLKAGKVTIIANAGDMCGSSELNITEATDQQWQTGSDRYNNSNMLINPYADAGAEAGRVSFNLDAGNPLDPPGNPPACTNCHGPTATAGVFQGIAHTPEQTGGYSDQDLVNVVMNGVIPDGGVYDPSIIPYMFWQFLHRWSDLTPDQQKGIIVYLRAITPAAQSGKFNFGGLMRDGGGFTRMPDAGVTTTPDTGTTTPDTGTTTPDTGTTTTDSGVTGDEGTADAGATGDAGTD